MQDRKNVLLMCALGSAILSLPMTWMTIRGAQIQGGPGMLLNSALGGLTIDVTGLNGHVTLLVQTPIWFIACVAAAASGLQLLRRTGKAEVPRILEWATACAATVWVVFAVFVALTSGQATIGLGAILGLIAAGIPLGCLLAGRDGGHVDSSTTEPFV